ncbi:transcriptional repressor CTCFL-like isoform X1 [Daktulosphaira vitifoliae]|uniref:transcriptional repressor CTCFL-like isoform X1 n=1 Tax=Daktulosphaira vitifoliae TaxID=58002 RepID=UPI0021A9950D|nr:transcriptional repressor CTCFL-like isoform X1 [Daktulosphaira vitifoliae]XP_050519985.1 transcriptional repressor CTCFL-like isoform X1 [Daktulosphaira vitifoliae]XP_050520060.1 transcriptional repressor CTCFL-like isoform X1 [Daktulosphaira vitifoliae]
MSENESIPDGTTLVLSDGNTESTMTIDTDHIKLEATASGTENITDIQNYLDSFNKEIEGNDGTQVTGADSESVEHAYFIDQNVQYYYQTTTGDGQMVMVGGISEQDAQLMAETNDNNMEIVIPGQQDKSKKDLAQIVALGDGSGYQTVTLVQADSEANNYVLYVVKQNDKNGESSNVSMEISQDDPDDPDISNVYDFNDGEDPTIIKKPIVDSAEEDDKNKVAKIPPKKSQTVTQAHMCNYCNYTTGKRYLLSRHMKSHSKERPHKCTVCERGFKTLTSLQNHVNTHTGTKPYQCRSCPSAFTTSGELVRHVRYKHTHEKPHKCTICDYASVELSKMRNHMRCHTGERPYQCPHCTYASPDTFKLKRHLRIHTGEKPYECDICFSRFTQSNSLKTHRLIHSGEKPVFKCEHCPATCGRKTDLRIHVQKLHTSDKPIKCKRCGEAFPDRYKYKVHCKSHEGEKCYKCELCSYASMSQRHLETHMLIHTDEKPFHCKLCDQSFRQKQLLRRHHNLYHNPAYIPPPPHEKTHQCNTCQRSFRHKGNLLRHMEVHMQDSNAQDRNTAMKQRIEYTDSTNEDESEEDTSIPTNETGVVAVEGEDGQQYVVLEVIQLDGQDQMDGYTSTSVSIQQSDEPSTEQKDLTILKTASLLDVKEECGDGVENCFGFDDEDEEETTNSGV